jgi:hypothetical protein
MPVTLRNEIERDSIFNKKIYCIKYYLNWNLNDEFYYHYTSKYFARQILNDMKIIASKARIPHFGCGVFLTKLGPKEENDILLENNYRGNSKYKDRLECAFALKKNNFNRFIQIFDNFYPSRDIWKCIKDVDLTKCSFFLIFRE